MKLAVLGGSFNPIHTGHLVLADDVCVSFGYDKLLFIPTFNPPHKIPENMCSAEDRLQMVRKACSGDSRFEAEDCEIKRGGVSYTYDTICYLEEKYKSVLEGKIGLVMGSDLHSHFHLWYKAEEIARKCDLILAERPVTAEKKEFANHPSGDYGKEYTEDDPACEINRKLFQNALYLENPILPVSSTDIRRRCAEGRSFKYLVPSEVFSYIIKGKLYGYR